MVNGELVYYEVRRAKQVLNDPDKKRLVQSLIEEGMKNGGNSKKWE
jgi:hypothetical protein